MPLILKFIGFLAVALAGFCMSSLVFYGGIMLRLIPGMPVDSALPDFKTLYLGGALMLWVAATLAGLSCFVLEGKASRIAFCLPLALPFLYCVALMIAFNGFQG